VLQSGYLPNKRLLPPIEAHHLGYFNLWALF
jgi:hypothetical protein